MDNQSPGPIVGAHDESIRRGHELDPINVKPFVQFTVIMLVLFVAVWVICSYAFDMTAEKWSPDSNKNVRTAYEGKVNPLAKEFNDRSPDERIARIDSHAPKAGNPDERVYAPRLEAFKSLDFDGMPEYVRSANRETHKATNPPVYHPETIKPTRGPVLSPKLKEVLKFNGAKSEGYDATSYNPSSVVTPRAKASSGGRDLEKSVAVEEKHDEHGKAHGKEKEKH